jgi:hypothetical protein
MINTCITSIVRSKVLMQNELGRMIPSQEV